MTETAFASPPRARRSGLTRARVAPPAALALVLTAAALVGGCGRPSPQRAAPPNLLVISLCSVRADHMSLYGYVRETTPHLAALARDAWLFTHAVTPWPKTTPAFAALHSGRYGHDNGVMRVTGGQRLDDAHTTVAELLRDAGYDTAAFVSSGAIANDTNIFQQGFTLVDETWRRRRPFLSVTANALAWLDRPRRAPFFAWLHYNSAHLPYSATGAPRGLFVDDEHYDPSVKVPLNDGSPLDLPVPRGYPTRDQILRPDMWGVRPHTVLAARPDELAYYVAKYDGGIYGVDRMIGELLEGLAERGLLDSTVVALVGDHGEALGEHGYYFGHGRLPYDDVVRVPLLVRPAGGEPARRITAPVSTLGLAPTLLELAGVAVPVEMAVPSLVPLAEGTAPGDLVFAEAGYPLDYPLSVRDERFKLIYVPNPIDRSLMRGTVFELYDLVDDPAETRDVAAEHPEVVRRLRRALLRWSRGWIRRAYGEAAPARPIEDEETRRELEALGYLR